MSDDTKYYGADDDVAAVEQKLKNLQKHYEARLDVQYKNNAGLAWQRDFAEKDAITMHVRARAAEALITKMANPLLIDFSEIRELALEYLKKFPERLPDPVERKSIADQRPSAERPVLYPGQWE
jgi:hypothetical protein